MSLVRSIVLTFVLSTTAAALGAWGGAQYIAAQVSHPPTLHQTLHDKLHLTPDQQRRIEGLERDHAAKRAALEAEMRAANAQLAQAYQEGHAYTPKVQAAIDRFHRAMDALQTETMLHVFAMRQVLTPDQTGRFDDTVVRSLTDQAL
jgi:Spy/CpxP family protein refolding chaperone